MFGASYDKEAEWRKAATPEELAKAEKFEKEIEDCKERLQDLIALRAPIVQRCQSRIAYAKTRRKAHDLRDRQK